MGTFFCVKVLRKRAIWVELDSIVFWGACFIFRARTPLLKNEWQTMEGLISPLKIFAKKLHPSVQNNVVNPSKSFTWPFKLSWRKLLKKNIQCCKYKTVFFLQLSWVWNIVLSRVWDYLKSIQQFWVPLNFVKMGKNYLVWNLPKLISRKFCVAEIRLKFFQDCLDSGHCKEKVPVALNNTF